MDTPDAIVIPSEADARLFNDVLDACFGLVKVASVPIALTAAAAVLKTPWFGLMVRNWELPLGLAVTTAFWAARYSVLLRRRMPDADPGIPNDLLATTMAFALMLLWSAWAVLLYGAVFLAILYVATLFI